MRMKELKPFNGGAAFGESEGDGRLFAMSRLLPLGHPDNTASSGSIVREASVTPDPFPDGSFP